MIIKGFTRLEVSELTGVNVNRLQYLDRTGVVVGHRIGNSRKPILAYSWNQILQILYIRDSEKELTDSELVDFIKLLDKSIYYNKALVKIEFYYKDKLSTIVTWMDVESSEYSFMHILQKLIEELIALNKPHKTITIEEITIRSIYFFKPVCKYLLEVLDRVEKSESIDYHDFIYRSELSEASELSDLISA